VKQLQQFLGMVNFYRRFLPGIARKLQPLTDALRGDPKTLQWPTTASFEAAKAALAAAVPLAHPTQNAVLSLATDASNMHVGGVLQHCQWGKVHKHVHLQPAVIPVPHRPFAHIHVDLVGRLLPSRGHTYLFTIINRTSRWPEAILLSSITAADCARALFAGWVSQFGVPATITSDRGPSSRPPCGRASAVCSTSSIRPRQHTILSQTGW
jgi:hypothetical protein